MSKFKRSQAAHYRALLGTQDIDKAMYHSTVWLKQRELGRVLSKSYRKKVWQSIKKKKRVP